MKIIKSLLNILIIIFFIYLFWPILKYSIVNLYFSIFLLSVIVSFALFVLYKKYFFNPKQVAFFYAILSNSNFYDISKHTNNSIKVINPSFIYLSMRFFVLILCEISDWFLFLDFFTDNPYYFDDSKYSFYNISIHNSNTIHKSKCNLSIIDSNLIIKCTIFKKRKLFNRHHDAVDEYVIPIENITNINDIIATNLFSQNNYIILTFNTNEKAIFKYKKFNKYEFKQIYKNLKFKIHSN